MRRLCKHGTLLLFKLLPLTRLFRLKANLLKYTGINIDNSVRVVSSAKFITTGSITLGKDTWIGHEVMFVGGNAAITLGCNCDIAPRVLFVTGTHKINPQGPHVAGHGYSLPINIGDGCWICAGSIILGGTNIGERSIVMAGAVVKGYFPASSVIGGVPAKILRKTTPCSVERPG